mmetsp:Transcript_30583/g.63878  ORF Transcript_30583/g.63878 Transcript_30583/m.63878 type:complete len:224 (-) Transcript_30583:342-1013(-)
MSDFCINSPDAKVTWILQDQKGGSFSDSVVYQLARFYVNGCSPEFVPNQLIRLRDTFVVLLQAIDHLSTLVLETEPEEWSIVCGSDFSVVETTAVWLQEQVCVLSETLEDINRFFWCRNWSSIYVFILYDGICYDAHASLISIAGPMLGIVILSLVSLMLRAGLFSVQEEGDYESAPSCLRRCYLKCSDAVLSVRHRYRKELHNTPVNEGSRMDDSPDIVVDA